MSRPMTIEELRMHHQHHAALAKVGESVSTLTKAIQNLPFALANLTEGKRVYVVHKEFFDPDNDVFDVSIVGVYAKRDDAEIVVRNEFVKFEAEQGFGKEHTMQITEENPWRIAVIARGGHMSAEFCLTEAEVE